jgi:hypothetical protein
MNKKQAGTKRRRKFLPWAIFGMIMGAGIAFTLVRWQKKSMPWTKLDREVDDFSIYETGGDTTGEWPAKSATEADDPTFDGTDSGGVTGLEF